MLYECIYLKTQQYEKFDLFSGICLTYDKLP